MNFSPLDIIILPILVIFVLFGLKNKFIRTIKTTFNLTVSLVLSNLILDNIKITNILSHQSQIMSLCVFLILFVLLSLLIGFLLDFAIYQSEDPELDPIADKTLGALVGLVKGFIVTALLIFIFDTTPLTVEMKNKITNKISSESFFFAPCNNLKSFLLK
tara:strand:- start:194 stop:673 length:480 start_codon:yes stop_codon:yes gene_type:complete